MTGALAHNREPTAYVMAPLRVLLLLPLLLSLLAGRLGNAHVSLGSLRAGRRSRCAAGRALAPA
eukprot:11191031-Lingulodinium_polyedra.AAC.1